MLTTCSHNEDWPDVTKCNADLLIIRIVRLNYGDVCKFDQLLQDD